MTTFLKLLRIKRARKGVSLQDLHQEFSMTMMDLKEILTKAGRKVTIGITGTLKTQFVRGEERVLSMINGGMDLNAALLGMGGQHLSWNLPANLANVVVAKGTVRVWIELNRRSILRRGIQKLQSPIYESSPSKSACLMKA